MPNSWKLAEKWTKFDDSGLRELSVTNISNNALSGDDVDTTPTIANAEWYDATFYQPTYGVFGKRRRSLKK